MTTTQTATIMIGPGGKITGVETEALRAILTATGADATTHRASNVWPQQAAKRAVFRLVRACVSDRGRVAQWTRGWKGPWMVHVHQGPTLGPFEDRGEAIAAEIEWLNENRI